MHIVIIGAGAAGLTLASNLREKNNETEITVFTRNEEIAYSPCAIPLVLGGSVDSFDDIVMHDADYYLDKNIQIHLSTDVTDVDSFKKIITYNRDGNTETMTYDKLVIATGGETVPPEFEIEDMKNIHYLANIADGRAIQKSIEDGEDIVFISNLSMGVESAYELADKGYNVTFLDQAFSVLPLFLDEEMSDKLLDLNDGIDFEINVNVEGIVNNDLKKEIHYNGKTITADAVILSAGRIPSTLLAEKAGCEIGEYGVVIDKYLETNVDDIYAIGDCVEVESHITGGQTVSPAGTTAVRQAMILAENLSGNLLEFDPVVNTVVSKVGNYYYACSGITEVFANMIGMSVVSANIETCQKARYCQQNTNLYIKMVCKDDGTVVGCQMISDADISSKIDVLSFIISNDMKCFEIIQKEFSYTPTLTTVVNPLVKVALKVAKKIDISCLS